MRQYIISEERLKDFIRHERELFYAHECVFYSPSEKELEVTDENLKRFKELNEYIKERRDEILQDNAEGGYYDINEDFKEIIEKLKNSTLIYLISFKFMIIIGLKEKISILYIIQDCILRSVSRILKV